MSLRTIINYLKDYNKLFHLIMNFKFFTGLGKAAFSRFQKVYRQNLNNTPKNTFMIKMSQK